MTICVSTKVRDGIVLGTDSMTQIQATAAAGATPMVLKAYQYARKLFQVGSLPVGMECWGIGNFGNRTIESLVLEFGQTRTSREVKAIATEFYNFIQPQYAALFGSLPEDKRPAVGFLFGGYSDSQPLAEEWEFLLPRDSQPNPVRALGVFGASWRGIDGPFTRLFVGYDARIPLELAKAGVPQATLSAIFQQVRWAIPVILDAMPLQDGINFTEFVLRATIGACEFMTGTPACGGPLQVAVIRPDRNFLWIAEPKLHLRGVEAI